MRSKTNDVLALPCYRSSLHNRRFTCSCGLARAKRLDRPERPAGPNWLDRPDWPEERRCSRTKCRGWLALPPRRGWVLPGTSASQPHQGGIGVRFRQRGVSSARQHPPAAASASDDEAGRSGRGSTPIVSLALKDPLAWFASHVDHELTVISIRETIAGHVGQSSGRHLKAIRLLVRYSKS